MLSFAVDEDSGPPFFDLLVVPDAPVFRGGVDFWIAGVSGVVGGSGGAQVGFAIVQAVMVDVVDEEIIGDVYDYSVHCNC